MLQRVRTSRFAGLLVPVLIAVVLLAVLLAGMTLLDLWPAPVDGPVRV